MKKGLILEGGAMRGMFTAGVIDVMMEHNIVFDGAIGVSAGAVFGCNYKSHQIGRSLRYNTKFCQDPRYASFRSLLTTGDLYGADFCYNEIPNKLDPFDLETYRNSPMEFYVVCTDVETGKPVYQKCMTGDAHDIMWMRASASMPLVSRIVEVDGYKLLDGGISDSIPIRQFQKLGYDRNIIVLTQPLDYVKPKNQMVPLLRVMMRKYPNLVRTMRFRHDIYNATTAYIRKLEQKGRVLVIRPEAPLGIARVEHDPKELTRVYQLGRDVAEKRLKEMQTFLAGK
ncbi:MAG: patatin family protein [Clostridiales bacterium]|nr:patatin family protein [Clostridiales bacterium]